MESNINNLVRTVHFQNLCATYDGCNFYTYDGANTHCMLFEDCSEQSGEFCQSCVSGQPGCDVGNDKLVYSIPGLKMSTRLHELIPSDQSWGSVHGRGGQDLGKRGLVFNYKASDCTELSHQDQHPHQDLRQLLLPAKQQLHPRSPLEIRFLAEGHLGRTFLSFQLQPIRPYQHLFGAA